MHPNWNSICEDCPRTKKYQLIIMDEDGKATYGKTFDSWNEIFKAMIELRNVYAENNVNHHVGYREV